MINCGNPTRSVLVLDLIKAVKKKEVRKQGKASAARRPLEAQEFTNTINALRRCKDSIRRYQMVSLCSFQFHMVGRIDDCVQLKKENLKPNLRFPFTLICQLCWSKNVKDERDAPDQFLMGAMDPQYCVLLNLAIHLETEGMSNGSSLENDWVFPLGTDNPRNAKNKAYRIIDVDLPYPDANVAAALCIGGACKYVLKESCGVTDDWLLETVAPNILLQFPREVALTLARPLLWAVFEPHLQGYLPDTLTERVRSAYAFVRRLPAAANPVEKIPIIITGAEGEVYIDEIGVDLDQGAGGSGVYKVVPQGEQPAGGAQRRLAGQQRNEVVATWAVFSAEENTTRHERDHGCRPAQIVGLKSAMQKGMTKLNTSKSRNCAPYKNVRQGKGLKLVSRSPLQL